jgi:hypothetical protein
MIIVGYILLLSIPAELAATFAIYVLSNRTSAAFTWKKDVKVRDLLDTRLKKSLFLLAWVAKLSFFIALTVLVYISWNNVE